MLALTRVLALVLALVAGGCGREEIDPAATEVVASGPVEEVLDQRAFVLVRHPRASKGRAGSDRLLVIHSSTRPLSPGQIVRVRGRVEAFSRRAAEHELGRGLPTEAFAEFERRPYLRAVTVSSESSEGGGATNGSSSVNTTPPSGALAAWMVPSTTRAASMAIASPSPAPPPDLALSPL